MLKNTFFLLVFCFCSKLLLAGPLFPQTYLLNMDRSKDRLAKMQARLHQAGFSQNQGSYKRFPAVDGSGIDILELESLGIYQKESSVMTRPMSKGEFGNYLSHRAIWYDILSNKHEFALVLEDDVVFADDFMRKAGDLVSKAPVDWHLLYLGCNGKSGFGPPIDWLPKDSSGMLVRLDARGSSGNFGYLISRKGAQLLAQNSIPITGATDEHIRQRLMSREDFRAYCAVNELIWDDGNQSGSLIDEMGRK